MIGCRHGAKNTLDKNYLWLAERRGLREAESPFSRLELMRGHAEVEHDAVDAVDAEPREDLLQVGVVSLDEELALSEGLQNPSGLRKGIVVPVDADQNAAGGRGLEDSPGMTSAAHGAVHVNAAGLQVQ